MTAIITHNGELLCILEGNAETIALNTPLNCVAVDNPPRASMYYEDGAWLDIPQQLSAAHTFDYATKSWVDLRSLQDVRAQQWNTIKVARDACEFGGLLFDGHLFDSDAASQSRIATAIALGCAVDWTLRDNSVFPLSPTKLSELHAALARHVADCHTRSRKARTAIAAATTISEVLAVTF